MSLTRLELTADAVVPPADIVALLDDAQRRIEQFRESRRDSPLPGFVTGNAFIAREALRRLADDGLIAGRRFCEWGAGFGVVASLAATLGYEASGIEIEPDLVAEARRLSAAHAIDVEFFVGSYTPAGAFDDTIDEDRLHEPLGFRPTEFDVIYVYPWPAERKIVAGLFERFAPRDALLVSYHGGKDLQVHRKT